MLKKMLCLVIALMLALNCASALAADDGADPMTLEELLAWADGYRQMAEKSELLNDPHDEDALTEDGYAFVYTFGILYFDVPELTEDAVLTGLVIYDEDYPGLRGTQVGMPYEQVIAAFYQENDELVGARDGAMLYLMNDMPVEASAALVLRDGQRIEAVQYSVYDQRAAGGDGYVAAGVTYTVSDGLVYAMRAYGLDSCAAEADVRQELADMAVLQGETGYVRVTSSLNGADLTMFGEADLTLAGMDLTSVTPEQAEAALGTVLEDIWTENGEDGFIRTVEFAGCEMVFLYDQRKTQSSLMMLDITVDGMEGPRGVRVGDTFSSVMCRFHYGDGEFTGATDVLYGAEGEAYGVAEYGHGGAAILRYALPLTDGRTAALMVSFEQLVANEVLIYFN